MSAFDLKLMKQVTLIIDVCIFNYLLLSLYVSFSCSRRRVLEGRNRVIYISKSEHAV